MATVVVVQSGDLAAWVGIAGVAIGVFLTAGVDSLRKRLAERSDRKQILVDGAFKILSAGRALARTETLAGANDMQQPWVEMIERREDAVLAEYHKVVKAMSKRAFRVGSRRASRVMALYDAATKLLDVCAETPGPDLSAQQIAIAQREATDAWFLLVERKNMTTDVPNGS